MMMNHHTMFDFKRLKNSGDMEQLNFEDLTPHCDLDLEVRKPTFSHYTPGHDHAPSNPVS